MPTINLRDARKRNAQVRAESIGSRSTVRYVGPDEAPAKLRKVLRATMEHSFERLRDEAGGDDALGAALLGGDPEVDIERAGMFLDSPARVYVNERNEIVYQINQIEIVRTPGGEEKERRPRRRPEPNVDSEIPVNWTGRLLKKEDALQRFVFASKMQIMHVNGLTYDFLYAMAKELAEAESLMLLTAGKNGKEPLIFRHGATPYRGFLEGRISGDKYVLLLHLSNQELKRPASVEPVAEAVKEAAKPAEVKPEPEATKPVVAEIKAEETAAAKPKKAAAPRKTKAKAEVEPAVEAAPVEAMNVETVKAIEEKPAKAPKPKRSTAKAAAASPNAATDTPPAPKKPRPASARAKS